MSLRVSYFLLFLLTFSCFSCSHKKKKYLDVGAVVTHYGNSDITNITARNIYEKGLRDIDREKYEEAEKSFLEADSIFPNSTNILTSLGGTMAILDKKDSASMLFKKALSLDTNFSPSYVTYGCWLNATNNPRQAILILNRGLKVRPLSKKSKALLFYNLACAYNSLKEYQNIQVALDSASIEYVSEDLSDGIKDLRLELQNKSMQK